MFIEKVGDESSLAVTGVGGDQSNRMARFAISLAVKRAAKATLALVAEAVLRTQENPDRGPGCSTPVAASGFAGFR